MNAHKKKEGGGHLIIHTYLDSSKAFLLFYLILCHFDKEWKKKLVSIGGVGQAELVCGGGI